MPGACWAPSLPSRFLISASASENGWLTSLVSARIVLESPRKDFGARTIAPDCGKSAGVFVPRAYQPPAKQGATRTKQQP